MTNGRSRIILCIMGAGLAALAACGKAERRPSGRDLPPAIPVELVEAKARSMSKTVSATGTFSAHHASTISAKVAGRVELLAVDLGSVVRKGDVLARMELRDFELALHQANAALAQARTALGLPPTGDDDRIELQDASNVKQARAVLDEATKNRDRVKSLSASGIAAQAELDTVEAAYQVARTRYEAALEDAQGRLAAVAQRRAEVELARKRLTDATILAPFDGAVQNRPASLGEYLPAGSSIVQLVQTDPLRLRLQVPERDAGLLQFGQTVRVTVEGDTNIYTGQIARLSPALDEQTRMLLVEADVRAQGLLRPGLFARAEIVIREDEQGLSVPASAIITFAGLEKVVLVRDNKAVEKPVVTGRRGRDWVEIVSGLEAGQRVVPRPAGLRTGQPVTVQSPGASPDRPAGMDTTAAR